MTHRADTRVSCQRAGPLPLRPALLLLFVFLSLLVPSALGKQEGFGDEGNKVDRYLELRCICVKTVSGIHPSKMQSLEVIQPGPHCEKVQVIATLKDGRKVCLDPKVLANKKVLQYLLRAHGPAV
ncbi:platelet basic protein-like [Perognathus longimembris pacificus]|uniref:platelet basic protein-like n=1 Tax=Perognathus longimembris pacificus TaxID=214514 RepID=UPI002018A08E|nr:platelet basic protein-like [Perognathus longimembris pacificus]